MVDVIKSTTISMSDKVPVARVAASPITTIVSAALKPACPKFFIPFATSVAENFVSLATFLMVSPKRTT